MNYKLYDNGQIMKVISEGHEVAHTMNNIIEINGVTIAVSESKEISVIYKVFNLETGEHETDTSINKTVDVYVNDVLAGQEQIVNGEGVIEFKSEDVGTFEITIEGYKCEVIVNEN